MYNTVYECTKPITLYTEKDKEEVTVNKKSRWSLTLCSTSQAFKELTGTNESDGTTVTIALPDELVDSHFKQI